MHINTQYTSVIEIRCQCEYTYSHSDIPIDMNVDILPVLPEVVSADGLDGTANVLVSQGKQTPPEADIEHFKHCNLLFFDYI